MRSSLQNSENPKSKPENRIQEKRWTARCELQKFGKLCLDELLVPIPRFPFSLRNRWNSIPQEKSKRRSHTKVGPQSRCVHQSTPFSLSPKQFSHSRNLENAVHKLLIATNRHRRRFIPPLSSKEKKEPSTTSSSKIMRRIGRTLAPPSSSIESVIVRRK